MARGRTRGVTQSKSWATMAAANSVALTQTQAVIGSVSVVEFGLIAPTLLRSRGSLLVVGTPNAGGDADTIGLGLIVVHTNALAVGGTSVPGPLNDVGADWLWHRFVALDAIGATSEVPTSVATWERVEVDGKAMRRVPTDHAVALVGEVQEGLFVSVAVTGSIRFLFGS